MEEIVTPIVNERAATNSKPEDLFAELFTEVFGLEKALLLVPEYPVSDVEQGVRYVDFALWTRDQQIAFEIDRLTWHVPDAYPVSAGHTLIILRRHTCTFFELTEVEWLAVYDLLTRAKGRLTSMAKPNGYNVGVNEGAAASLTVLHLHIHVIPRYTSDVASPFDGIRNVIPGKVKGRPVIPLAWYPLRRDPQRYSWQRAVWVEAVATVTGFVS